MTWEELVLKAEKLGYNFYDENNLLNERLCKNFIYFDCDGTIWFENGSFVQDLAINRTPDQIYQIMLALED